MNTRTIRCLSLFIVAPVAGRADAIHPIEYESNNLFIVFIIDAVVLLGGAVKRGLLHTRHVLSIRLGIMTQRNGAPMRRSEAIAFRRSFSISSADREADGKRHPIREVTDQRRQQPRADVRSVQEKHA